MTETNISLQEAILVCLHDWNDYIPFNKVSTTFYDTFWKMSKKYDLTDVWELISVYQKLDSHQLLKYKRVLHWKYISKYQSLSEKQIKQFREHLDWELVCIHQNMSQRFIQDCIKKRYFTNISLGLFKKLVEKYQRPLKKVESKEMCPICFDYTANTVLPCGHFIHDGKCLEWIHTHNDCPICRQKVYDECTADPLGDYERENVTRFYQIKEFK